MGLCADAAVVNDTLWEHRELSRLFLELQTIHRLSKLWSRLLLCEISREPAEFGKNWVCVGIQEVRAAAAAQQFHPIIGP